MTNYWLITAAVLVSLYALLLLIKRTSNKILVGLIGSAQFTISLLWLFYANFGEINLYIFCVTFFFDAVFIVLCLRAYLVDRKSRPAPDESSALRDDWLAIITIVGFIFHYVLPVVGWGIAPLAVESNWRAIYGMRVLCAIVLPTISGLLMLFFLFRRTALLVYVPLVLLITALPVWSGLDTALDLHDGPRMRIIRHGCYSDTSDFLYTGYYLCNGQKVFRSDAKKDEEILLLPHTGRVLRMRESEILDVPAVRGELQIGTRAVEQ